MSFRLLGRVSVTNGERSADLGGPTAKALLSVLLLRADVGVSADELVALVWGTKGGASRDSLYHYVSRLRAAFATLGDESIIEARKPGYRIRAPEEAVDWRQFRRLVAGSRQARDAGDLDDAALLLLRALDLWRGPALADVGDRLQPIRRDMTGSRLSAVEDLASLELSRGHPDIALEMLAPEAELHPGRERCAALVIRALHTLGRRDEATDTYRRTRTHLAEHLGIDPTDALEDAYRDALRGRSAPVGKPTAGWAGTGGLPRDAAHFTGRDAELRKILRLLTETRQPRGTARICVIAGMAGVGKTALAVHSVHQIADRFPDGTLFLDLHGYARDTPPLSAADALDRLVRRLGVAGDQVPEHPEERAALYRERLAGKRLLVILDNAHDSAQVEPLLPATPECPVLITSRSRLAALDDAHVVSLGPLPASDGVALLYAVVGNPDRTARGADQDTDAYDVVALCGGLPLAVRIAAARHRGTGARTLADLRDQLADTRARLAEFNDGERSVAAAFTVSYRDLPGDQRQLFAMLALHPGDDIDAFATAALIGTSHRHAERLLDNLVASHMLIPYDSGRYRLHNLLHTYARDIAAPEIPPPDRATGVRRLLDYYLRVADQADQVVAPHRFKFPLDVTYEPQAHPEVGHYLAALDWLTAEQANLVASCLSAAEHGLHRHCWQIAYTLRGLFFLTKQWRSWIDTHEAAVAAARLLGDIRAEAMTLNNLGLAHLERGDLNPAAVHYERALELFRTMDDHYGEPVALSNYSWVLFYRGYYAESRRAAERALAFYQSAGSHRNAAITLRGIALAEIELSHFADAVRHLEEALGTFEHLDLTLDATMALNGLGEAYHRWKQPERATNYLIRAADLSLACGSGYEEARAYALLGRIAAEAAQNDHARQHWRRALSRYTSLDAPQAAAVRALLAELGTDGTSLCS